MRVRPLWWVALLSVIVFVIVGFVYLTDTVDSYDRRYTACMEVEKGLMPMPIRYNFRAEEHQDMMAECDRRASQ